MTQQSSFAVPTIAALQALPISGSAAPASGATCYVGAEYVNGYFAWNAANLSAYVANDPCQGVYVASTNDVPAVTISGSITPNLTGAYYLAGTYNGCPYYYHSGVGYIWCWTPPGSTIYWVLSPTLGDDSTDIFYIVSGAFTPPSGNWAALGGSTGIATSIAGSPGAVGAWVRQYSGPVDWVWWGMVDDAVFTQTPEWVTTAASGTDNYNALVGWQIWARYQASLGLPVAVKLRPRNTGAIGWSYQSVPAGRPGGAFWTSGIAELDIDFGNCTMQQLTSGVGGTACFPIPVCANLVPYLINQTTPETYVFTLQTPSQSTNLTVGQQVCLASCDLQHSGFPPNTQYYQFVQIASVTSYGSASVVSATYSPTSPTRLDFCDFRGA
jgi:hypothetical protein